MGANPRSCQRCGKEIPVERIEALPNTLICVRCSKEIGSEFVVTAVPDNLGKAGSLKKNYGAWTVRKVRRRIVPKDD